MRPTTPGPSRATKETKSTALVHRTLRVRPTKQAGTMARDKSWKEPLREGKAILPLKGRRHESKHSTTKTRDPSRLRLSNFRGENTTAEFRSVGHPPKS